MIKFLQSGGRTQKIVLGGILVVFCALMVISLIPGGLANPTSGDTTQGSLARVDGEDVTVLQVTQLADSMSNQQFRGHAPEQLKPYFQRRALDQIITQRALMAQADHLGLKVTDQEVTNFLHAGQLGEIFFPAGHFIGQEQYESIVQNEFRIGVQQFEEQIRMQILLQKLVATVGAGVTVADNDIAREFEHENTKVKLQYAVVTTADLAKQVHPSEGELKAYYDQNKSRYANAIPEKRRADYIMIDQQKVMEQVKSQITNDQLLAYYRQHQEQYRTPEQVRARHILIKTPPPAADGKVDQKALDAARAKAMDVLKQVQGGANFADLAKKYSEDTSAKDGGELGWLGHGQTVAAFDQAMFSMQPGQTSGLVQSEFGFHIINVEERRPAGLKPFSEVKDQVLQQLAQEKTATAVDMLTNKVETQAKAQGLDKAAASNGLQVYHSEPFTRTDTLPGVGAAPELMSAMFEAKANDPPASVRLRQGYAIIVVTAVQPAQTPTFDAWRSHVEEDFKQQRAQEMLMQRTRELADRAHAEHDLKKAAKELGFEVKTSDPVALNGQVADLGSMSAGPSVAFSLQTGEISQAIQTDSGGAVLQVLEKQAPGGDELSKGKEELRGRLMEQKREQRLQVFISDVRARMMKAGKIRYNEDEWKRLTGGRQGKLSA